MTMNVFERILYGIKVANDNIVSLHEKVDALMQSLAYEETEPCEDPGAEDRVGDFNHML